MDDERNQYWEYAKDGWLPPKHAMIELRATMAWELIRAYGSIAGIFMDREDSARRAVMELQTPGALVTRCFAIADAFVNRAESRGEIRKLPENNPPTLGKLTRSIKDLGGALDTLAGGAGGALVPPVAREEEPK